MIFDVPDTADLDQPATQAITKYKLDPNRVRKALIILSYGCVTKTYNGQGIEPDEYEVKSLSSDSFYTVTPDEHSCTCPDTVFSPHICKHRIAVYLYEQRLERMSKTNQLLQAIGF